MSVSYSELYKMLTKEIEEQPEEFITVMNTINRERCDEDIYELMIQLTKKEVQVVTYSHT